ncbi:glycoside hydrolase family 1 [Termitidicoccus mucosus]|uniref:Glycoside hydrolase family 1 n=2 Tax=Termitidicoccus mucosus TaxID=1184151 RepID=A0A178IDY4_9BACT|nr:glycoside hydrolase family 1 [Opitutaceae bacterium TSB47]
MRLLMPTRSREKKIIQAWMETSRRGVVELAADWKARAMPPLSLGADGPRMATLLKIPEFLFARRSGYHVGVKGEIFFYLWLDQHRQLREPGVTVYLAGDFNNWQHAVGSDEWRMHLTRLDGADVFMWCGRAERFFGAPPMRFKFVTGGHVWLPVPYDAPNAARDDAGNVNFQIIPERTGRHLFAFTLDEPVDLSADIRVRWQNEDGVTLRPGEYFFRQQSDVALGAIVLQGETLFRIFAPRASRVELCLCNDLAYENSPHRYPLSRRDDGVWEVALEQELTGWYYWYHIDGPKNELGRFDPAQRILDPYALATVDRMGPGVVVDLGRWPKPDRSFRTPAWQDLVIAEAHVRDLTARAPIKLADEERRGFTGLRKWVESEEFYLHQLGVNAVELQPVQEFDNREMTEYHWGYMTCNYFSPESSYALQPSQASGVREFQDLVKAFHKRGMAVILDVVYNHVGDPAHLLMVDQYYYFHQDRDGTLSNWSGCGNDLRADAAMARRLITDSCRFMVERYGVDGFRFDLAELLGVDVLREIELELKRVKPDVILIAEPWSFRGHIAGELRDTGWASWNDGYRNFLRDYVRGGGTHETYEYFLKGSPWHFAKWPAQTVNYTESHDDRAWLDVITENPNNDGATPTANDRRRTHLMAAVLFMSVGIPMLSAGQDFLRSKGGVNNTYQRGDLNALDYRRIRRFPATHEYFADWIAFRLGDSGRLLRHYSRASDGFFRFFFANGSGAAVTLYNADHSLGRERLLFAVNPSPHDVDMEIPEDVAAGKWLQLADQEHFFHGRGVRFGMPVASRMQFPPLSCALWIDEGAGKR